MNIKLQGE
ncbi:hypothetical protein SOVF_128150, partial [Spinacia oleracea]